MAERITKQDEIIHESADKGKERGEPAVPAASEQPAAPSTDELLQKVSDYRSGYTCGYSDARNGQRYRDKDAAALFFHIEGIPDIAVPDGLPGDEFRLDQGEPAPPAPQLYLCPVCGYGMADRPANYNICPSCGTEFGVNDQDATIEELRSEWIKTGPNWWSENERPENWNPYEQLANLISATSANNSFAKGEPAPPAPAASETYTTCPHEYAEVDGATADGYCPICLRGRLVRAEGELQKLQEALEESVKLQSHYAKLLNMHDGGKRIGFANAQAWLDRLAALREKGSES